jgi:hypothetical protein
LRIGGHALRLSGSSQLAVLSLDESMTAVQLQGGVLNVRWRDEEKNTRVLIHVPDGQIELLEPGRYRIDMLQNGATVTVFQGRAQAVQDGNAVPVSTSRSLTAENGRFTFESALSSEFDEWALARDERTRTANATRFVSPLMTGYDDLDEYGRWDNDPAYGTVWFPSTVPAGWAPYRYGRWRWVHPWGWTWVDAAPWGFAPFHYGRWVWLHGTWGWTPGAYAARPVFAPALVAYESSPGLSISLSIGSPPRAWVPLAPWERFEPRYRHRPEHLTQINQTVIINRPPASVSPNLNHQPGRTSDPVRYGRPAERAPEPLQRGDERASRGQVGSPSVIVPGAPQQGGGRFESGRNETGRKSLPFERGAIESGNHDRNPVDRNPFNAAPPRMEPARPVERSAPVERVAPVDRALPIERPAPVQRTQPFERGPIDRSPPAERQMPIERPVPPKLMPPVQPQVQQPQQQPVQRAPVPPQAPAPQAVVPPPAPAQTANERRREEAKKFERQNEK